MSDMLDRNLPVRVGIAWALRPVSSASSSSSAASHSSGMLSSSPILVCLIYALMCSASASSYLFLYCLVSPCLVSAADQLPESVVSKLNAISSSSSSSQQSQEQQQQQEAKVELSSTDVLSAQIAMASKYIVDVTSTRTLLSFLAGSLPSFPHLLLPSGCALLCVPFVWLLLER